ncbi:MAG: 30S ribosomal protein S8 [Myxococcota bacterium]|nr:30S ribosomal protein S8 [Myxococcota bacterium]
MSFVNDPIADLLTRIRNAQLARHAEVTIPGSKLKYEIAKILDRHGYVEATSWSDEGLQGQITIVLRYNENNDPMIRELKRISKPSRRVYVGVGDIPSVLNGLGIAILSTSRGVITGKEAKAANVGGELLCSVY